jgi:predicted nucleic acid-binding protein
VISLLDVNVLVAFAWPNHVHHAAAQHWFDADQVVAIIRP